MAQVNISSPESGGFLHHVVSTETYGYGWELTLPTILSILSPLLASVFWAVWKHYSPSQRLVKGIPIVGGSETLIRHRNRQEFFEDSKARLLEGYRQAKGGPFYIPTPLGERLMIPPEMTEELKAAPVDKVDFIAHFLEMFEGKYIDIGTRSTLHPRTIKTQLSQNLSQVMDMVQDEVRDAFEETWPECEDWTEVPVLYAITPIVARASSFMLGGKTLSRDPEWVEVAIDFTTAFFFGSKKLKELPRFVRHIAKYFIPEVRQTVQHHKVAQKLAVPLLKRYANEEPSLENSNLLYWMKHDAKGYERDDRFIASVLPKVTAAAIHTSAAAPAQLIFDLCERPEYIPMIREEFQQYVDSDGKFRGNSFYKMRIMDSVMKESQRFNPPVLVSFQRLVHQDWKLSSGFVIPAGTTIGVATHAQSMDPELYEDVDKFDGLRFLKIREKASTAEEGRQQFAFASPTNMVFGYGRHVCPGRFFAADLVKSIMAYLIENYDMKFKEGQTRPESYGYQTTNIPHRTATVLFKRRKPKST
ncbi:cytochrome P450 monooxygenase [Xylaria arbuscula]|nr:cytochrome P450 monooxygenase [Xylaria arbuscula]